MEVQSMQATQFPEWKELVGKALKWDYGSAHTHEEMGLIMKLKPGTARYRQMVARAIKELETNGKTLASIPKFGYRVLLPDEYAGHSVRIIDSGKRRIRRGHKIITYAPTALMSEEGKRKYTVVLDRASALHAMVQGGCKELKLLVRPKLEISAPRG
jgi:hypothetical protein